MHFTPSQCLLTLPPGKPGTQLVSCLRTLLYYFFFLRNHQPALIFLQFQRTQAKFSLDVREREKSLSPCLEEWRTNVTRLWSSSKKFPLSNLRFKWIPSLSFIKCGGLEMLAEPFLWAPFTILTQVVQNPSLECKNTSWLLSAVIELLIILEHNISKSPFNTRLPHHL